MDTLFDDIVIDAVTCRISDHIGRFLTSCITVLGCSTYSFR